MELIGTVQTELPSLLPLEADSQDRSKWLSTRLINHSFTPIQENTRNPKTCRVSPSQRSCTVLQSCPPTCCHPYHPCHPCCLCRLCLGTWPIFEIQTAREWDILPLESVHISFQLGSVTGNLWLQDTQQPCTAPLLRDPEVCRVVDRPRNKIPQTWEPLLYEVKPENVSNINTMMIQQ